MLGMLGTQTSKVESNALTYEIPHRATLVEGPRGLDVSISGFALPSVIRHRLVWYYW